MDAPFSLTTRAQNLAAMAREPVDLLIIGGGINGAAIARDAAMRGIRTAMVDKGDFGWGTSGRSSRLIHGGLRYLEHRDFRLVFEASRERRTLLRIAPHLVWPRSFVFPLYQGGRVHPWKLAAGLWLYDALALFRNVKRHRTLSKRAMLRAEPGLRDRGLLGGARYFDAHCDDSRLTLATARDAQVHGALVANHARVERLEVADARVRGAKIMDELTGERFSVRALAVVNATGPWADSVRAWAGDPPALRLTKGVHVAVRRARIGNNEAVTVISPLDGRVMFLVPWGEQTYVGTTDTDYSGNPDAVGPDASDVLYLLRSANALFPNARLQADDVVSAWAGLRPLFRPADDRDPGAVSREHRIVEGATGLISVLGGKLTTHRAMAAETVDVVLRGLNRLDGRPATVACRTAREPLLGGEVRDLDLLIQEAVREGAPETEARRLVHLYGTETVALVRAVRADPQLARPVAAGHPATKGQLLHAVRREMAATLSDLLVRRLRIFHEAPGHAAAEAPSIVDFLAGELGWDAARQAAELAAYLEEVAQMLSFRAHLRKRLSGPNYQP